MAIAMTSKMMPLATPSAPGEKCSSLVSRPPRTSKSAALGIFRHVRGRLQERHQRDLGPDPDQQQQERVDDEGGIQRFEIFHRTPSGIAVVSPPVTCVMRTP